MTGTEAARHLDEWASLGRRFLIAQSREPYPSWNSCSKLIQAASRYSTVRADELRNLLAASQRVLAPLPDPLAARFDLHRWLRNDREEAYSDWLAWLLSELRDGASVGMFLFGDSIPEEIRETKAVCKVERERWVPAGHKDQAGRLDCVVTFGDTIVIVIEVKVQGADSADTVKQIGYFNWLTEQDALCQRALLLTTDAKKAADYDKFNVVLWRDLSRRGRKLLPILCAEGEL